MKMNQQKTKLVTWLLIIGAIAMATTPSIAVVKTVRWDEFEVPKTSCQLIFNGHVASPGRWLTVEVETVYQGSREGYVRVISEPNRRLTRYNTTIERPRFKNAEFTISIEEQDHGGRLVQKRMVAKINCKCISFDDKYIVMGDQDQGAKHPDIVKLIIRPFITLLRHPVEMDSVPDYSLPAGKHGIIKHGYYTLKYNAHLKIPMWVAYSLTREMITEGSGWRFAGDLKLVEDAIIEGSTKERIFFEDPELVVRGINCPTTMDYCHTGYTRGHLKPAADAMWNQEAHDETFYMSNVCPQVLEFNAGIWNRLEKLTRKWASKFEELYITTGPVLKQGHEYKRISDKGIAVPDKFFKVILLYDPQLHYGQAVGFILENKGSDVPLREQAMSVDEVEKVTGIDFFAALPNDIKKRIKSNFDVNFWDWNEEPLRDTTISVDRVDSFSALLDDIERRREDSDDNSWEWSELPLRWPTVSIEQEVEKDTGTDSLKALLGDISCTGGKELWR